MVPGTNAALPDVLSAFDRCCGESSCGPAHRFMGSGLNVTSHGSARDCGFATKMQCKVVNYKTHNSADILTIFALLVKIEHHRGLSRVRSHMPPGSI